MENDSQLVRALELFQEAYQCHMKGDVEEAVELYTASIEAHPTAEAHTFRGWAYSTQGRLDEAIAECQRAIQLDPEFGNPYNDIGAYLIEQQKIDEAIPWLERALVATRYESYHYPWFNLGRAFVAKHLYNRALECFGKALAIEPHYELARNAIQTIRKRIN